MTVSMNVSELVSHLRLAVAADPTPGADHDATSHRLLGTLFHASFADAVGPAPELNVFALMEDLEAPRPQMDRMVEEHIYDRILGPRLADHNNLLHPLSAQVLTLWDAAKSLAEWLTTLAWTYGAHRHDDPPTAWARLRKTIQAEVPVDAVLTDPSWREPVRLTGIADVLLRIPNNSRWCAVELKTGKVPEELALLQACLYQMALASEASTAGAVGIVRFGGGKQDSTSFGHRHLVPVREKLVRLIGAAANILTDEAPANDAPPSGAPVSVNVKTTEDDFAESLVTAFSDLNLGVSLADAVEVGPTFKRYRLELSRRTSWARVKGSLDDLEIRLGARRPMTLLRDVGRIYLDVERPDRQVVYFRDVQLPPPDAQRAKLLVGLKIDGTPVMLDLADATTPHVLVSGTTGSGKSEWLTMALTSLAKDRSPDQLRLTLIDPKRTAFSALRASPYLWEPAGLVLPPDDDPVAALSLLVEEMERRYVELEAKGVRDIAEYAQQEGTTLPRIVCACDEFMDLMLGSEQRRQVETLIARLGAKARAAGIHLILATQQPKRDVLSTTIQSNLPARIALKAASPVEAKMMQCHGAEKLLGKGDLLLRSIGEPQRLQAPLVANTTRDAVFGLS